ncbi:MAG: shikimate kinase [Acidobacteriota bacterium]
MDGYYDYGPTIQLERHIAIFGLLADETRTVAYRVSAIFGLPVTDVDRTIEHSAGRSVWDLIWSQGEARYRELEDVHARAAIRARPLGVISLGDGALISEPLRRHLLAETDVIALDMDLANCYWRLQGTERSKADYWHPLHPGPLERLEQVKPFFSQRRPALDAAHHRVELGGSSVERAARQVAAVVTRLQVPQTPAQAG